MAPWCSGLTCHPVTVEIAGSNPAGVANYSQKPHSHSNREHPLSLVLCAHLDSGISPRFTSFSVLMEPIALAAKPLASIFSE